MGCSVLADDEPRESRDLDVLARLRRQLGAKVPDRLALVAVGADVLLLEEGHLLRPLRELNLDDLVAPLLRLAVLASLRLVPAALRLARVFGNLARRDVHGRRRRS